MGKTKPKRRRSEGRKPTASDTTDGPTSQLATRISRDLHRALKTFAVRHEQTIQDIIERAVRAEIGRGRPSGPARPKRKGGSKATPPPKEVVAPEPETSS
jgi:hypothetical protein